MADSPLLAALMPMAESEVDELVGVAIMLVGVWRMAEYVGMTVAVVQLVGRCVLHWERRHFPRLDFHCGDRSFGALFGLVFRFPFVLVWIHLTLSVPVDCGSVRGEVFENEFFGKVLALLGSPRVEGLAAT